MNALTQHGESAEGRHTTTILVAAIVSLVVHVLLYEAVGERRLTLFDAMTTELARARRARATLRATIAPPPLPRLPDPLRATGPTGPGELSSAALLARLTQPSAAAIFEPPPFTVAPRTSPAAERSAPPPPPDLPVWEPRQEIVSLLDAAARDLRAPLPRREIPRIERQRLAPDITASYDLLAGLAKVAAAPMPAPGAALTVDLSPPSAVQGGDPAPPIPNLGPEAEGATATHLVAELPAAVAPAYPLEDRLRIAVTVYDASRRDGFRYFQIDVMPKDAQALTVLPRDLIFVQDTSASLGERCLQPCRVAILEALATLRPEDRFNIVQFSDTVTRGFEDWAYPNAANLERAAAFVNGLRAGGNTDIFASMEEVLRMPRQPGRPVIAVLATDGIATAGALTRESQIIGTFSRLNGGEVSVFTLGTSPRANVFLLDMLSFNNRGGMTAVSPDRFSVTQTYGELLRSLERPLLAGVRFNFDVVSGAEVYPRLTTNLYEDRPLRLFGRVAAEQPRVAFQARGEAREQRYDMLFEVDLTAADVRTGAAALRTQWGIQRMYDLVARFARTEDPQIVGAMQRLGNEFGIPVPYAQRRQP